MVFVINEWLWEDSAGHNGLAAQRDAFDVITKLAASQHQIVVIEGSAFDQKAWACCTSADARTRDLARHFLGAIRIDSDRCRLLEAQTAATLPDELASSIKADDQYLVNAQLTVEGSVLVTTDGPLREIVRHAGLRCIWREEFLAILAEV